MAIAFACPECGKKFKVADEKAGSKGKCPVCATIFEVPDAEDSPSANVAPSRRELPVEDDYDEDDRPRRKRPAEDDDQEERPRPRSKKKKKKGSPTGLILGLLGGAVGLLLIAGLVLWLVLRPAPPPTVADDLKYLPDNSEVFITLDLNAILGSELYKRLRGETLALNNMPQRALHGLALDLADLERLTAGGASADTGLVFVMRCKKSVSLKDLTAQEPKKYVQEELFGKYQVHHDGTSAVCVPERKTILVGPYQAVKKLLERGGTKASFSANLQSAFEQVDLGKPMAGALDTTPVPLARQPGQVRATDLQALMQSMGIPDVQPESVFGQADLVPSASFSLTVVCKSAGDAEKIKKAIDGQLALVKGAAAVAKLARKEAVPKEVTEVLKHLQITLTDRKLNIALTADNNTLVGFAKQAAAGGRAFP